MSRSRWFAVNLFIASIVGMQILDVIIGGERWPFAPYNMYASEQGNQISWYRVYGVTDAGEFPLDQDQYHEPIDNSRFSFSFATRRMNQWVVLPPARVMLGVVARLYERARVAGEHQGPRLAGLRLYQDTWVLSPTLANKSNPERHHLIEEIHIHE
jgi:hypothetical protein